ncbi:MAG: response regulator [Holdemanella biformis]|uniref:response regulator n=1 Tax=Holdemanella biformis TaxID=1735 RepID=UPI00242C0E8F|nr:response regulator [Holdemanella biformis]MBS6454929.1 response regulator [Holdemanella biformis]
MKNKNLFYQILISFVLVSVLTNMACLFIRNSVIQQEKLKAEYTVNSTINRVEIKLESYIEKVGFLKKTIEAGIDVDDAYFESMASRLYGDDPAVKTIELAPNGIIQNVYPFKENQKAIGMNMLAEYERKEAATLAKDTRKYTLEGPYDLKQGGKGALLYDPIYVNEKFWGFSILVIDWDAFLDEIHLSDLKKASYDFVIWKTDRVTKKKIIISQSSKNIDSNTLLIKCKLPNNKWNFEIVPKQGWINTYVMISLAVASILIDFLVTAAIAQFEIRHRKDLEYASQIEWQAKKAQEASAAKSRFLFSMSHDIRTPMNAIMGYTELMEKNIGNAEKEKDYLSKIHSSSKFLLDLINSILEMARIESGKETLNIKACNIFDVLDSLNSVFEKQAEQKGLTYQCNTKIEHPYVYCDQIKFEEILLNVIGNSVKYTKNGNISIHVEEVETGSFQCIIQDTGIGMSEAYLPHAFEDFSREKSGTQTSIKGTGLGLSIVKSLVELMHGTIEISSQVNQGTTTRMKFHFEIAKESELEKNQETNIIDLKGKHILLAEDNDLNAEIAMTLLFDYGFIVDHVSDGIACVKQVKEKEYDVVLMDIQMPNMDGYQATQKIREFSDIPIVAMTANAFEEDKQKALSIGMNGHIAKPIDMDKVIKTLSNVFVFKCPVCGKYTFQSGPGSYEICPVCGWEDDKAQYKDPNLKGGANRLSLKEYKKQYEKNHE